MSFITSFFDMIQTNTFQLLLDLLDLPDQESYSSFPERLELQLSTAKTPYFFHRYGVIFQAYWDFLLSKINLEEFLSVGDINSSYLLKDFSQTTDFLALRKNNSLPSNSAIIFDQKLFETAFSLAVQQEILADLQSKNSLLQLYP